MSRQHRNSFIEFLQLKGLSQLSIKAYLYYYDKFQEITDFNQDKVNKFVLMEGNHPPVRAFISNAKEFILSNHLIADETTIRSIELAKKTGAKARKIPDILSLEQIQQLESGFGSERNKLMLWYQFYGGLRVQELIRIGIYDFAINWQDVDNNIKAGKNIKLTSLKIKGKRNKERIVYVPGWLIVRTYNWLIESFLGGKPGENTLIFKIGIRRWQQLLSIAAEKAIGKSINPHTLRHSCGSWLHHDRGWDLDEVKKYLGHESVVTTTIYTHVKDLQLEQKMNQAFQGGIISERG